MLLRWVRWGLIPPPVRRGYGRGKGRKASDWEPSCIERIRLITKPVGTEGRRINRKAAERILIAKGYGVSGERLRLHLKELCIKAGAEVSKRRGNYPHGWDNSLTRAVQDRLPHSPPDVKALHRWMSLAVASIEKDGDTPEGRISRALSNRAIRETIKNITAADLERIYTDTGKWTDLGVASGLMLAQLRLVLKSDRFTWLAHFTGVGDAFVARCAVVLWGILIDKHGPVLQRDILEVISISMLHAMKEVARLPINDGPGRAGGNPTATPRSGPEEIRPSPHAPNIHT